MMRPSCRKCGGLLNLQRLDVLEGCGCADVIYCVICGDIYKERQVVAHGRRELTRSNTAPDSRYIQKPGKKKGCSVRGCKEKHSAHGLCRKHYQLEYKRRITAERKAQSHASAAL